MIQKSKIGVGASSKNANFVPREYIRILYCFRTFSLFTLAPSKGSGPVRAHSSRTQLACSSPQE